MSIHTKEESGKPHDGGSRRRGLTITFSLTAAFPGKPPFMLALQLDS